VGLYKNDRNPDTSDLHINGLLSATLYQGRGGAVDERTIN
jgi:hypothetical protein